MIAAGAALAEQAVLVLFAMLRIGAAFVVAPPFASSGMPLPVRIGLAAAIGFVIAGSHRDVLPDDPVSAAGAAAAAGEVTLGIAMGFVLRVALAAPHIAGDYVANAMGLGFAAMANPDGGGQSPVIANLLAMLAVVIFLGADGHHLFIQSVVESYRLYPPGDAWPGAERAFGIAAFGSVMFSIALAIALPALVALTAVNLVLAVLTRSAPQLNIFAVGLPATMIVGIAVLALGLVDATEPMLEIAGEALR